MCPVYTHQHAGPAGHAPNSVELQARQAQQAQQAINM